MKKPIVAANWKMNKVPSSGNVFTSDLMSIVGEINNTDIIICPPFTSLYNVDLKTPFYLGAQNFHYENDGAYTGEVSINMLKDCNVNYVIIGHSERRNIFLEIDKNIRKKIIVALNNKIKPILCVGENLKDRNNGVSFEVIKNQLLKGLEDIRSLNNICIAYEPIWAIGTGETAKPDQINDMHKFIRNIISEEYSKNESENISILYGGSVNSDNASELISINGVNGFLIGGASLDIAIFSDIVRIVSNNYMR